jgi:NADH-quinone oxidoreductase subunit M
MNGLPLLSILIALPLVAGVICLFVSANAARWIALVSTLIGFAMGIWMWTAYVPGGPQWQFQELVPLGGGTSCHFFASPESLAREHAASATTITSQRTMREF